MRHCTRNIQAAKLQKKQQTTKQRAVQFSATKSRFISKPTMQYARLHRCKSIFLRKKLLSGLAKRRVCALIYNV